jgi:DNA-binding cell septation regulator SpoVG
MSVNGIEITEIRVHPVKKKEGSGALEAFARVVLNGQLCMNSIRVMKGKYGPFVAYPREFSRTEEKGYQFFYPITKPLQNYLSEQILNQWKTVAA